MRVPLVVIKRQIVDDVAFLSAALGICTAFLLSLGGLAFVYPQSRQLGVLSLLVVMPSLTAMGFVLVGILQGRTSRSSAVVQHLSTYPVRPVLLRLAAGLSGMFTVVVTVAVMSIGVAGAIATGIIEWPGPLRPSGFADLMVAVFLIALSCYSLGLYMGHCLGGNGVWVIAWPIALALASLMIAKGLGPPLILPLAAFSILSLFSFLFPARWKRAAMLTQGLLILMLLAVPLYWLRTYVDTLTASTTLDVAGESRLVHWRFPRCVRSNGDGENFTIEAAVGADDSLRSYRYPWLARAMRSLETQQRCADRLYSHTRFDTDKGLFVNYDRPPLYAGPRAVAEAPSTSLGAFESPVVCTEPKYHSRRDPVVVFDSNSRCFYMIDFAQRQVRRGVALPDMLFQPVDVIDHGPVRAIWFVHCGYPSMWAEDEPYGAAPASLFAPIVDRSGRIAVLDLRDLTLIPEAGRLPAPHTFFGRGSPLPRHCLDYRVQVVIKKPEKTYAGLAVACLPRQRAPLTLAFFPADGRGIEEARVAPSHRSLMSSLALKGLVESLHPPVLTLASFFLAERFDAGQAWRTLLFVPNSLVAQQRDRQTGFLLQLAMALVFVLPAVFLAALLAWRIAIDAKRIGLSSGSRRLWLVATLAFGLPAYITYRFARPRVTLLICRNCGQPRRAEMERCHHCGKGWHMPEIDARGWQVTDAEPRASDRCLPA